MPIRVLATSPSVAQRIFRSRLASRRRSGSIYAGHGYVSCPIRSGSGILVDAADASGSCGRTNGGGPGRRVGAPGCRAATATLFVFPARSARQVCDTRGLEPARCRARLLTVSSLHHGPKSKPTYYLEDLPDGRRRRFTPCAVCRSPSSGASTSPSWVHGSVNRR
jgi:hypothetical protein